MNAAIRTFSRLLLLSIGSNALFAEVEHSVGVARSEDDRDLQYIEHHQYFEDGRHQVNYYDPSLEIIAYKRLTYPRLPQHPRIEQKNFREGTETLVEPLEDRIAMVRKQDDGTTKEISVERRPDVVCDAGFDAYIKSEWEALVDAETTRVRFAIAGRSSTLAMKVEVASVDDPDRVGFRISPRNFFVGMFIPAIELEYRESDRQLMQYNGYSNLATRDDEKVVNIAFQHYTTADRLERPLEHWLPETMSSEKIASRDMERAR